MTNFIQNDDYMLDRFSQRTDEDKAIDNAVRKILSDAGVGGEYTVTPENKVDATNLLRRVVDAVTDKNCDNATGIMDTIVCHVYEAVYPQKENYLPLSDPAVVDEVLARRGTYSTVSTEQLMAMIKGHNFTDKELQDVICEIKECVEDDDCSDIDSDDGATIYDIKEEHNIEESSLNPKP
jgi:hypothetical protein